MSLIMIILGGFFETYLIIGTIRVKRLMTGTIHISQRILQTVSLVIKRQILSEVGVQCTYNYDVYIVKCR